jgi:ADP-ribosylglycohydrolase
MEERDMNVIRQRARNAMLGLAMGDALSWPAMFHRSYLLPSWTRRIRREMDAVSETSNILPFAMPFSLNQPAEVFDIAPTDDSEWAAFTANILLKQDDRFEDSLLDAWLTLAQSGEIIKGGVSTQAALSNLRKDIKPPRSGRENPHYFDDGAVSRAVPIGIFCAGNPDKAAEKAGLDASVTNAEDGVWAAQAMAMAVSLACGGGNTNEVLGTSIQVLPQSSLVRRKVDEALALVKECGSLFSVLPKLQNIVINREYSYGNAAPETLALTFVIARLEGNDFEHAITTAASFAKTADSLPATVGALVGAMNSGVIASESWLAAITTLKGICIPSLAGADFLKLTDRLVDAALRNHGKDA